MARSIILLLLVALVLLILIYVPYIAAADNDNTVIVAADGTGNFKDIQSAVDALPNGGKVLIKEGIYTIDKSINLAKNMAVIGSGDNTVVKLGNNVDPVPLRGIFSIKNKENILISDLKIDGNMANNPTFEQWGRQVGISMWDSRNITIRRINIIDIPHTGVFSIRLDGCLIDDVTVRRAGYGGRGIHIYFSNNCMITNCYTEIPAPGFDGVYLDNTNNSKIINCIAINSQWDGLGIFGPHAYNNEIRDSTSLHSGGGNIFVSASGNRIINNVCNYGQTGIWLGGEPFGWARNNLFQDNKCNYNARYGLILSPNFNTFSNNNFIYNQECMYNPGTNSTFNNNLCEPTLSTRQNDAHFIYQNVPTNMAAGERYKVEIIMQNNGTSMWTRADNYRLGSQNSPDNAIWGIGRILFDQQDTINMGAHKLFTFNVIAPSTPGIYNFQWQMLREGVQWFGARTPNIAITVESPVICGNNICDPGETTQSCPQDCQVTCSNECSPSGTKQCFGNGYQTCGNSDADSCLEWSSITTCLTGQTCSNGQCVITTLCGNSICDANENEISCPEDCVSQTGSCNPDGTDELGLCIMACGADIACNGKQPRITLPYCSKVGITAVLDKCSSSCKVEDKPDKICRRTGIEDCTGDWECHGKQAGTYNCDDNCNYIPPACGNGICEFGETLDTCYVDCVDIKIESCGNNKCDSPESCSDCPEDCGVCPPSIVEESVCGNAICEAGETAESCQADCNEILINLTEKQLEQEKQKEEEQNVVSIYISNFFSKVKCLFRSIFLFENYGICLASI